MPSITPKDVEMFFQSKLLDAQFLVGVIYNSNFSLTIYIRPR
jgi:hypothetical protein